MHRRKGKSHYLPPSQTSPPRRKNPEHQTTTESFRLDMGVVRDRGDGLGDVGIHGDEVTLTGHGGLTLEVEVDTLLMGLALLLGILLDTIDEILTGTRVLDVLDPDADALLDVAVADDLVQEDTDGGLGHVVDNAGLAVVDLVGHTVFCLSFSDLDL